MDNLGHTAAQSGDGDVSGIRFCEGEVAVGSDVRVRVDSRKSFSMASPFGPISLNPPELIMMFFTPFSPQSSTAAGTNFEPEIQKVLNYPVSNVKLF